MSGGNGRAFITPCSSLLTQTTVIVPVAICLAALRERTHIAHALLPDRHDADACVEFVLELQRPVIVERGGHTRKANVGATRGDADAGRPPQRVLRLFHVAEVVAEMDDARGVDFVEHHTTAEGEFGEGHLRIERSEGAMGRRCEGPVRRCEGPKVRSEGPKVRRSETSERSETRVLHPRTTGPSHWTLAPSPRRPFAPLPVLPTCIESLRAAAERIA